MATRSENIQTALDNIYAELAAGPLRPDYSIDGQRVSWMDYRNSLLKQAEMLESRLAAAEGPWEEVHLGQT